MQTLLAIDDDPQMLRYYVTVFPPHETTLEGVSTAAEGLDKLSAWQPDAVLLDVELPDLSGLEAFRRIHALAPKLPVIFVTGSGTADTAIEAMKLGAYDYLLKPFQVEHLRELVSRAVEAGRLMRVPAMLPQEQPPGGPDVLIGRCPAMQEVYKAIGRVAGQDVTVLILGESGTGKELVARATYQHSRRSAGPFLALNCAALPEPLLESELFGHEKGAFTGAERTRIGKFEQCDGGTLFLDEVGDMAALTQTKLLRVLQSGHFERVGGDTIRADVRLIAATNRDLERLVADGTFRGDLYYRLNVYPIRLPPLRERGDDLPLLLDHFLHRFRWELDKDVRTVAPGALELLRRYPWPGNVRELQSVLKRAILQATGPVLLPESLPPPFAGRHRLPAVGTTTTSVISDWDCFIEGRVHAGSQNLYVEWQAFTDHRLFSHVIRHTKGNLSHAAKILGIHRATVRARLEALGLTTERTAPAADMPPEA